MKTEFNWFDELHKAIKSEPSRKTCLYFIDRNLSWGTCACGELCKALPRDVDGAPEDFELVSAGQDFSFFICEKDWTNALIALNKIEARTAKLLNEQRS